MDTLQFYITGCRFGQSEISDHKCVVASMQQKEFISCAFKKDLRFLATFGGLEVMGLLCVNEVRNMYKYHFYMELWFQVFIELMCEFFSCVFQFLSRSKLKKKFGFSTYVKCITHNSCVLEVWVLCSK